MIDEASDSLIKGNVISGNGSVGVYILGADSAAPANSTQQSLDNSLVGNIIGTNAYFDTLLGNRVGGFFELDSSSNTIGGTSEDDCNIISGNESDGVYLSGQYSSNNSVLGNIIGPAPVGSGHSSSMRGRRRHFQLSIQHHRR